MKKTYDAIIIGGGVIGGSILYELTKRGLRVLLLEQGRLVRGASSAAAGMIAAQTEFDADGPLFRLALQSRSIFQEKVEELQQFSKLNVGYVKSGIIKVATQAEEITRLHRMNQAHQSVGERSSWLSTVQLRSMEPNVNINAIVSALLHERDAQIIAPNWSHAYLEASRALGATILENIDIIQLSLNKNQIRGVETSVGIFSSENVILATGVNKPNDRICKQLQFDWPVFPVKGEAFSVRSADSIINHSIVASNVYLVPKSDGRIIVGATMQPNQYDFEVDTQSINTLLQRAVQLVPSIQAYEIESTWAGHRPTTPDHLPLLGELKSINGMFIANGFFRNGILMSPIAGELMAALVSKTAWNSNFDLKPFDPHRFTNQVAKGTLIP